MGENKEHKNTIFKLNREIRMSNPCHIITPVFANKLLKEFKTINNTVDVFMHRQSYASKKFGWTAHPPAATELSWSKGKFESLIHPRKVRRDYLKKVGKELEAKNYEAKIADHLKHFYYRRFLIVGHPRCGTGFAAELMRQFSLDIGHESDGVDGLSTWCFAADGDAPYWKDPIARRRKALKWSKLIMVIRDINNAIPSIMLDNTFAEESYQYRRTWIIKNGGIDLDSLENNFQRAVYSYLQWFKMIESMNPDLIFRIVD